MIAVYLLGSSQRRVLGHSLQHFAEVAARRANLEVLDTPPRTGEVIVIDRDAAISSAALTALVEADRIPNGPALADPLLLVGRIDAARLRPATSVAELLAGRAIEVVAGLAVAPYRAPSDRRRAEAILLRGATKPLLSGDVMGVLNRELTLPLVKPFARLGIHPNAVTLLGLGFTIAAAFALAHGGYAWFLLGAVIQWMGSLLDGVDGKLARLTGKTTPFGHRLDHRLDVVYYAALFGSLAIGMARTHSLSLVLVTTAILVAGLLAEFAIEAYMRGTLVPREHPERFGPLVYRVIDTYRSDRVLGFARATIRVTTRAGLPHIFLAAALLGGLPVLFIVAAVATHLAWFVALRVLRFARAEQAGHAA
jgi:phosphatidylglycerophosphate synthase